MIVSKINDVSNPNFLDSYPLHEKEHVETATIARARAAVAAVFSHTAVDSRDHIGGTDLSVYCLIATYTVYGADYRTLLQPAVGVL